MTGYHNLKFAVDAMRTYSFQYLIKPFRIDQIVSLSERAQTELTLRKENQTLKDRISTLETELGKLSSIVDNIRPEEAGLNLTSKEKDFTKIKDADALNSYKRQKKSSLFSIPKK